jgi:surface antigen Omp85-like protein
MNWFPVYPRALASRWVRRSHGDDGVGDTFVRWIRACVWLWATVIVTAAPSWAQPPDADGADYQLPRGWISAPTAGLLPEPALLSKIALSSETALGGPPRDGWYVQTSGLITGQGWISLGPGYRRTVLSGRGRIDMSAAVSWYLSNAAQVSFELPQLAHGRLSLGTEARYQDARRVEYFGLGNNSLQSDRSAYRFRNVDVIGFGRVRAKPWLSIDGRVGWIPPPDLLAASGPRLNVPSTIDTFTDAGAPGISTQPAFIHSDLSVIADVLDHPRHPTSGGLYRATASVYADQGTGAYSFRRYEIEAAQFIPIGTRRWVLGLHGWAIFSDTSAGRTVPFYLMPSLGGTNTLRGYFNYRFHDNDLQNINIESRVALWTHVDVAVFADEGKVAPDASHLDFQSARTSYGAGVRFHNATSTLLRIDAGHSVEGWQVFVRVGDSFSRSRPASGRGAVVPFVP